MKSDKFQRNGVPGFSDSFYDIENQNNIPPDSMEEEPLYRLEDDNESDDEEDALYYYDEDDGEGDDEDNEEEEKEEEYKPWAFGILIKTLLTPVEGWKALKRAKFSTEHFANACFVPTVVVATLSEIIKVFYEANLTFTEILIDSLCTFLVFFFGYFTVIFVGGLVLPKKSRSFMQKEIGKQFVMLNLSTLALFWAAIQIVPMLDPVLVFLPIWTIYLIYKGVRVIRVPSNVENSTTGILCLLIIGLPIFWNWVLKEILLPSTGA